MPGKTVLGRDIVEELSKVGYRLVASEWDANVIYLANSMDTVLKITIEDVVETSE